MTLKMYLNRSRTYLKSNTIDKSNGGDGKDAGVVSTSTSELKEKIIDEVKMSKNPTTLKSVENILHELNTH